MTTFIRMAEIVLIVGTDILAFVAEPLVGLLLYGLLCTVFVFLYWSLYWLWHGRLPGAPPKSHTTVGTTIL